MRDLELVRQRWAKVADRHGTEVVHVFRHDVPPSAFPQAATVGRPRLALPKLREALVELGWKEVRGGG